MSIGINNRDNMYSYNQSDEIIGIQKVLNNFRVKKSIGARNKTEK